MITYCILVLLVCIISFAHPDFRFEYHNNFEMTHRFMGWAAVILVWILVCSLNLVPFSLLIRFQIVLLVNDYRTPSVPLGWALIHNIYFWLIFIFTCELAPLCFPLSSRCSQIKVSIALPWMRLRKHKVCSEVLSHHCVCLHFDYGKLGLATFNG